MSLNGQRVSKGEQTGVIISEPDENEFVMVHWGIQDRKKFQTLEKLTDLEQIESPPLEEKVGWVD